MFRWTNHKYWAIKVEIDWIKFDSKLESRFYVYLRDNTDIEILELQPRFLLQDKFRYNGKSIRKIEYVADFKIRVNWKEYIVDSKWMQDSVFKLKYKLWLKAYGEDNILLVAKSIKQLEEMIYE